MQSTMMYLHVKDIVDKSVDPVKNLQQLAIHQKQPIYYLNFLTFILCQSKLFEAIPNLKLTLYFRKKSYLVLFLTSSYKSYIRLWFLNNFLKRILFLIMTNYLILFLCVMQCEIKETFFMNQLLCRCDYYIKFVFTQRSKKTV